MGKLVCVSVMDVDFSDFQKEKMMKGQMVSNITDCTKYAYCDIM